MGRDARDDHRPAEKRPRLRPHRGGPRLAWEAGEGRRQLGHPLGQAAAVLPALHALSLHLGCGLVRPVRGRQLRPQKPFQQSCERQDATHAATAQRAEAREGSEPEGGATKRAGQTLPGPRAQAAAHPRGHEDAHWPLGEGNRVGRGRQLAPPVVQSRIGRVAAARCALARSLGMRARLPARQVREAIRLGAGATSRRERAPCGRRGDWLLLRVPARARAARVLLRIPLWRFGKHRCRRRDGEHHAGGARVPRCWPRDLAGGHAHQAHRLRGHVHVPVASALRTSVRPPVPAVAPPADEPRARRRGAPQMGRARGGRSRSLCAPGPRSPLPPQPEHRSICRDWRAARPQEGVRGAGLSNTRVI
mmetsp:Transcript_26456/g.67105  ORF Transcript_26456/g.67105 Transcript_26456/m.67105 type:complete len:363 (+) Transcript_26456:1844-2932(+)